MSLKNQVEAILFAVGRGIDVEEVARLCNSSVNSVNEVLHQLEADYKNRDCALMVNGGEKIWKLNVREKYLNLVRNLIAETELSKPTMETLALISYKQPMLQSDIIKKRSVGAYDHIRELLDNGFISRQKKGRSYDIKLAPKFFEYFDVNDQKMRELFNEFEEDEVKIESSEEEVQKLEQERKEEIKIIQKEKEIKEVEEKKTYAHKMEEIDKELEGSE